jgi:signal transduction histidine kinase
MREHTSRILIALGIGAFVAVASNLIDAEFARLSVPVNSTDFDDLLIGFVSGLCAYAWASLQASRHSRRSLDEKLRQEGALQERMRLTREIHDTFAQGFSGMIANLEAADELLGERQDAQMLCERALRIGRKSLAEARSLLHGHRPPALQIWELREAVTNLVEMLRSETSLRATCLFEGIRPQLLPDHEVEVFRIVQEALTNVEKHAEARAVRITLRASESQIQLCIDDDGRGFVPGNPLVSRGFGLASMRERARNLGGLLWVYTQPGQGTQVVAFVPANCKPQGRSKPWQMPSAYKSSLPMTIPSSVKD